MRYCMGYPIRSFPWNGTDMGWEGGGYRPKQVVWDYESSDNLSLI